MDPKTREAYSRCLVEASRGFCLEFRILVEHYWSPRHEELRGWYIKFAPRVCCV